MSKRIFSLFGLICVSDRGARVEAGPETTSHQPLGATLTVLLQLRTKSEGPSKNVPNSAYVRQEIARWTVRLLFKLRRGWRRPTVPALKLSHLL